jgi:hypothetical protein
MAGSPEYTSRPVSAIAALSAANTNRDGATGTYATAYTFIAAASGGRGGRIDALTIVATGAATTAGMVRMFINAALVREFAIPAITPSGTVKAYTIPTTDGGDANGRLPLGIVCAPGDIVKFSTVNAEAFQVRVEGGEF